MLVLWQNVPLVTGKSSFPDVDAVYRDYIETACAEGWITGFSNGRFKAYSTLTRQQMAIIMVRAMGWEQMLCLNVLERLQQLARLTPER